MFEKTCYFQWPFKFTCFCGQTNNLATNFKKTEEIFSEVLYEWNKVTFMFKWLPEDKKVQHGLWMNAHCCTGYICHVITSILV